MESDGKVQGPIPESHREGNAESEENDITSLDFSIDDYPGIDGQVSLPKYPLKELADISLDGNTSQTRHPEIDFRSLESELGNTDVLTHAIHKHPAIFIPHIPRHIINAYTTEQNADGERPVILDPFSGSGTTGVEAKIAGRDFVGIEINPVSKLVSEVATTPIPYTILKRVVTDITEKLETARTEYHQEYDVEFLDQTKKDHWFEQNAIDGLTTIRKVVSEYIEDSHDWMFGLEPRERKVVRDLDLTSNDLSNRVSRWLILMIANTVFDVSNADPDISKAYRSERMRNQIDDGTHPPSPIQRYQSHLQASKSRLIKLWNEIYNTHTPATPEEWKDGTSTATESETVHQYCENWIEPDENSAHCATATVTLGDAKTFSLPGYKGSIDLAITSPPYINAMNYYRGTKLRLFWIQDLLDEITDLDAEHLRKSFVGTNFAGVPNLDRNLPAQIQEHWTDTQQAFNQTRLPALDEHIRNIHESELTDASRVSYITWRFFAEDMVKSLTRVFEHLKPGGYFFFIIGENTINGRRIQNHRFISDIVQNLGKFDTHGGELEPEDGFRFAGMGWDEIANRGLFQDRSHGNGIIEREWVIVLQKPPESQ